MPIAGAFEFHAEHGHFHFPLAAFGLYAVAPDGGIGPPVTLSPKNGFCIADSYLRDSSLPHAGEFGDWGSCSDPTSLRGLSVGAVDEYDYRDPGQSVPIDGLPDGTYWFRAIADPYNYLVESNENNNETDVKVTIANNTVQALAPVFPSSAPPTIEMSSPADGAIVSGSVLLTATNLIGGDEAEFLLDGQLLGDPVDSAPYIAVWDSTSVTNGPHWLAARTTNPLGIGGTSDVVQVTVANNAAPPGGLGIDRAVSSDGTSARSVAVSTTGPGRVLVAFVAADGPSSGGQTATVSGGGLAWTLVLRANGQRGTSEIWTATAIGQLSGASVTSTLASSAFDQSLTVIAFSGAAGIGASAAGGAASGAPQVQLTTTQAGSWTFGVGNDWDNAIARTLPAGQTMQHQWVDLPVGDTFWVQSQSAPTPSAGTPISIAAIAPTTDRWNLAAVELLPAPTPPDTSPPTVTLTDPEEDSTVHGNVVIAATVTDDQSVPVVQFYLDGAPLGAPVTTPPFIAVWNTRTQTDGLHTLECHCDRRRRQRRRRGARLDPRRQHRAAAGSDRRGLHDVSRRTGDARDSAVLHVGARTPAGRLRGLRRSRDRDADRSRERRRPHLDAREAQQRAARNLRDLVGEGDRRALQRDGQRVGRDRIHRLGIAHRDRILERGGDGDRERRERADWRAQHLRAGSRRGELGLRRRQRLRMVPSRVRRSPDR